MLHLVQNTSVKFSVKTLNFIWFCHFILCIKEYMIALTKGGKWPNSHEIKFIFGKKNYIPKFAPTNGGCSSAG